MLMVVERLSKVMFETPKPALESLGICGIVTLILRAPDGRIKAVRHARNMKVYGTFNVLASAVAQGQGLSACYLALGSGPDVASSDTALSVEITVCGSRTIGRYSHDANNPNWNLSWSFTANTTSFSTGQAGIFTSLTGGTLFLKATFARLSIMSQDLLQIAWLQSLASA